MKRTQLLLLALAAVFATASAEVFFEETFDGASAQRSRARADRLRLRRRLGFRETPRSRVSRSKR
jgi:hypothetical protein